MRSGGWRQTWRCWRTRWAHRSCDQWSATGCRRASSCSPARSRRSAPIAPDAQVGIAEEIRLRERDEQPLLSAREREVLDLVADGLNGPDIARRLQIAPSTVRTHMDHLYAKLDASERAELVAKAMRRGLLE
jgi:two-component system, NarL family, nitrate/nitrite response regulator NarL